MHIIVTAVHLTKEEIAALFSKHLGITETDYLLPETGTLVLKSSTEKPRAVSLLPSVHLAIVRPEMLHADMHHVLPKLKIVATLSSSPAPAALRILNFHVRGTRAEEFACVDGGELVIAGLDFDTFGNKIFRMSLLPCV
jgi:L-lactate utilization protein LutB